MMSLKGDGKPVSFIEDCAVPLEHLAEYTCALTEVFAKYGTRGTWYAHASVGTLHVRPILDMRVGGRREAPPRCAPSRKRPPTLVRRYKGAYSGEHGDGLCRGEWIEWQFGPALNQPSARSSSTWTRSACSIRARSSTRREWTTWRCCAFRRLPLRSLSHAASGYGVGLVGLGRTERSGDRSRSLRREPAETIPAASPRPSRCATTTATAANSTPERCAPAIALPSTSSI